MFNLTSDLRPVRVAGQAVDVPLRAAHGQRARGAGAAAGHAPARGASLLRHAGAGCGGSGLYPFI